MNIYPNSPLQSTVNQFCNADTFDPQLFWYDETNPKLYYLVIKYDGYNQTYKVILSGLLNGYSNGTSYDYRYDFSNFIKIAREKQPIPVYLTDGNTSPSTSVEYRDKVQYFYEPNGISTTFLLTHTSDLLVVNSTLIETSIDGNQYLISPNTPTELTHTNLNEYSFIDSDFEQRMTVDLNAHRETYLPISNIPIPSTVVQQNYAGRNLYNHNIVLDFAGGLFDTDKSVQTETQGYSPYAENIWLPYGFHLATTSMNSGTLGVYFTNIDLQPIKTLTFWVRTITGTLDFGVTSDTESYTITANTTWTKYSKRITTSVGYINFGINIPTTSSDLLFKYVKIESGTVATPFSLAPEYRDLQFFAHDQYGEPINYMKTSYDNTRYYTRLCYVPKEAYTVFVGGGNVDKFITVEDKECNEHEWFYYGKNGGLNKLITKGNVHEVDVVNKELIQLNNKKVPIKISTSKQLKVNTGYGWNQDIIYDLIKTPYVFKIEGANVEYSDRNLYIGGATEKTSVTEYLSYGDLSSAITKGNPTGIYTLSFDIKTDGTPGLMKAYTNPGLNNTFLYVMNEYGSIDAPYVNTTNEWVRHTFNVQFKIGSIAQTTTPLSFYGTYGSGNIPVVKNVKLEYGVATNTEFTLAPEEGITNETLIRLHQYQINNSTFEGYNGTPLSGTNLELILDDSKQYIRRTTVAMNFFD